LAKGVGADVQACVDDYDLRTVPVPWSEFTSCEAEKQHCQDHPDTLLKHCRKTCDMCQSTESSTRARCSTFTGDCPAGMVKRCADGKPCGILCADNPCTQLDEATCCTSPPSTNQIEYEGTYSDFAFGVGVGGLRHVLHRPNFAKFKSCTGTVCDDCHTDTECGWNRTPVYHQLNTVSDRVHVAEFWADCAAGAKAHWNVQARVIYDGVRADDLEEFHNAETRVYLAQEGGHMQGEEVDSDKHWYGSGLELWRDEDDMIVEPGSTRLYVTVKAKDVSKRIKVALRVMITDPPDSVADCMDNRMCLSELDTIRNDNAMQLKCLQDGCCDCSVPATAVDQECSDWTACLDNHTVDKIRLEALLSASVITSSPVISAVTPGPSAVTGDCIYPGNDDPESWECECAEDLDAACLHSTDPLDECYLQVMCNYADICQDWKDIKCTGSLLSRNNVSVQEDVAVFKDMQGRAQPPRSSNSSDSAELEESVSGKAGSKTCR